MSAPEKAPELGLDLPRGQQAHGQRLLQAVQARLAAARALRDTEAPTSPTDAKRKITVCVKAVAGLLGNTPTVCRASYVHPKVFALFESGEIGNALPGAETKGFEKALIKQLLAV